jgi:hypothetical protein
MRLSTAHHLLEMVSPDAGPGNARRHRLAPADVKPEQGEKGSQHRDGDCEYPVHFVPFSATMTRLSHLPCVSGEVKVNGTGAPCRAFGGAGAGPHSLQRT